MCLAMAWAAALALQAHRLRASDMSADRPGRPAEALDERSAAEGLVALAALVLALKAQKSSHRCSAPQLPQLAVALLATELRSFDSGLATGSDTRSRPAGMVLPRRHPHALRLLAAAPIQPPRHELAAIAAQHATHADLHPSSASCDLRKGQARGASGWPRVTQSRPIDGSTGSVLPDARAVQSRRQAWRCLCRSDGLRCERAQQLL